MGVRFYDQALVDKISKWWPQDNITILKPNETSRLWGIENDKNNDEPLKLPLIVISRDPSISIENVGRKNLSCRGIVLKQDEDKSFLLNAIPININYQIDIYTGGVDLNTGIPTQGYELGDEYIRTLLFNLINHPKLEVTIPYQGFNIKHTANIFLEGSITDNSDIPEKKFQDAFTRWTIRFKINDAYLFSIPEQNNARLVGAELEVKDIQPGDDVFSVEYSLPGYEKEY